MISLSKRDERFVSRKYSPFWPMAVLVCLLIATPVFGAVANSEANLTVVRVPERSLDGSHGRPDFFYDLLTRVLTLTIKEYGPFRIDAGKGRIAQMRLMAELQSGRLDVLWTASDLDREKIATPIRIPIDMGLIGQRVILIRAERVAEFAKVKSIDDLKRFTACQGTQWPDAAITAHSGLPQVTGQFLDQLYRMLQLGRCDYFARGVAEYTNEMAVFASKDVVIFDKLILSYFMPYYFFVSPGNEILAKRLESGLLMMVGSGELRRMLASHTSTRAAFPTDRFNDALTIRLPNPNLPPETPVGDSRLWISIGQPSGTLP